MEKHIAIYIFLCKLLICQNSGSQVMDQNVSANLMTSVIPQEKSEESS